MKFNEMNTLMKAFAMAFIFSNACFKEDVAEYKFGLAI